MRPVEGVFPKGKGLGPVEGVSPKGEGLGPVEDDSPKGKGLGPVEVSPHREMRFKSLGLVCLPGRDRIHSRSKSGNVYEFMVKFINVYLKRRGCNKII